MILYKLHKLDKGGDPRAAELLALLDACIKRLDLCEELGIYKSCAVGGAVYCGIMDNDKLAVLGNTHVKLDLVDADVDRRLKCGNSVLGVPLAQTSVRGNVNVVFALCPIIHLYFLPKYSRSAVGSFAVIRSAPLSINSFTVFSSSAQYICIGSPFFINTSAISERTMLPDRPISS